MTRALGDRIVRPYIFLDSDSFIRDILEDMESRHEDIGVGEDWVEIKEGAGGLRDIEQVLLMLNARIQVMEPVTVKLFGMLSVLAEEFSEPLELLARCHAFLREVRDLYRLTVAASDEIFKDHLGPVARIMHARIPEIPAEQGPFFQEIRRTMDLVTSAVSEIVSDEIR